jgi:hypothetical protein
MSYKLPEKANEYFRTQFLLPKWDETNTKGYDPSDGSMPTGTSISNVGAKYPSVIVSFSSESGGGASGYDYLTNDGAGSVQNGQLIVTIRAEDGEDGPLQEIYENDGTSPVTAEDIVTLIRQEIERICTNNENGGTTEFITLSATPGGENPDDLDSDPAVRIEDLTVNYTWLKD